MGSIESLILDTVALVNKVGSAVLDGASWGSEGTPELSAGVSQSINRIIDIKYIHKMLNWIR